MGKRFFSFRPLRKSDELSGLPVPELQSQLASYNSSCGCTSLHDLAGPADDELTQAVLDMMKAVWANQGMPEGLIDEQVVKLMSQQLWDDTVNGYGKDLVTLDWNTPDFKMLESLQKNVWHFSSAKNYSHLRELSNALSTPAGTVRSEADFLTEAFRINDTYIKQHLITERNLAITASQEASKWVSIQEDKDIFPFIEFDVVLDTHTSEICSPLAGVVVPVDHPYVKLYYPPNHFNCRTTTRKLRSGKITESLPYPEIPKMFQTNLAESGIIFPKGHAYFDGLPKEVTDAADKLMPNLKK